MHSNTSRERRTSLQRRSDVAVMRSDGAEPPPKLERMLHAAMGQLTQGISPHALALAWFDWAIHVAQSPGKWQQLAQKAQKAVRKDARFLDYAWRSALGLPVAPCIEALPQDRRFRASEWQQWPFNLMQQAFLLN